MRVCETVPRVSTRRTKIIATLGPSTDAPGRIDELVAAGMDGGRINCAHDDARGWRARAAALREAAERAGRPLALLVNLAGPKPRLGPGVAARGVDRGGARVRVPRGRDRRRRAGGLAAPGRCRHGGPLGDRHRRRHTALRRARGGPPDGGGEGPLRAPRRDRAAQGLLRDLRSGSPSHARRARHGRPRGGLRDGGRLRGPLVRALGPGRPPAARGSRRARQRGPRDRQDREGGGGGGPRRDRRRLGRRHGGPRRPGGGGRGRARSDHAEERHPDRRRPGEAGHHGHPDARVDGRPPASRRGRRRPTWRTRSWTAAPR